MENVMRLRMPILAAVFMIEALAAPVFSCTVGRSATGIQIPMEMVTQVELILRVTAVDYVMPPPGNIRTAGVPETKVRFTVMEVVKGTYVSREFILAGYLDSRNDWNDRTAPYDFVRPGGRRGSCFANTYRTGAQFLLVLKKNKVLQSTPSSSEADYTVNWYALGPVNEQLHSDADPWLLWVRNQVAKK